MGNTLSSLISDLKDKSELYFATLHVEIGKLAELYRDKLDNALGLPHKGEKLWKWELSENHEWQGGTEICELNASGGVHKNGVYSDANIPVYPAHADCKCVLKSTEDDDGVISRSRWKVVITGTNVKFTNESKAYSEKKEGTADDYEEEIGGQKKLTSIGKDPEDFDTPIFDAFMRDMEDLVDIVGKRIFKK